VERVPPRIVVDAGIVAARALAQCTHCRNALIVATKRPHGMRAFVGFAQSFAAKAAAMRCDDPCMTAIHRDAEIATGMPQCGTPRIKTSSAMTMRAKRP